MDVEALFVDPRLTQYIGDVVATRLTSALEPQLRSLGNQLRLLCEDTYSGASSRSCLLPQSPIEPMLDVSPQSEGRWRVLCQRFPGLGDSVANMPAECRLRLRNTTVERQGMAVEDVLQRLRILAPDFSPQRLQQLDPFLHALITSADEIAAQFLAAPRLLKLAQAALQLCKNRLDYHPDTTWSWQKPDKPAKVQTFICTVLQAVPAMGNAASEFAASADAVSEQARSYGPTQPSYPAGELQRRVALCLQLGILQSVQAAQPFAFAVVTHLDTILSIKIE